MQVGRRFVCTVARLAGEPLLQTEAFGILHRTRQVDSSELSVASIVNTATDRHSHRGLRPASSLRFQQPRPCGQWKSDTTGNRAVAVVPCHSLAEDSGDNATTVLLPFKLPGRSSGSHSESN
jgi:hypothetical protein